MKFISFIFILYFFSFLYFSSLYSQDLKQVSNTSSNQIDPALDKSKHVYVEIGYANWESASIKNFFKSIESSNFNGRSESSLLGKRDRIQSNSFSTLARAFSLGISLPSSNGFHKGNLAIGYMTTSNSYLDTLFYKQTNLVYGNSYLNNTDFGITLSSIGSISKYSMQYDHDIYLIPDHTSKYLVGLGIKLGLYIEHGTFSPKTISISNTESNLSILGSQTRLNGNGYPIPLRENYDDYSGTGIFGGVYRLATFPNQELEISGLYYKGYGKIYQSSRYYTYAPISDDLFFPIQNTEKYISNTDVEGRLYSFSYLFKLTDFRSLKLFILQKDMNYRTTRIELKSNLDSLIALPPLGPIPDVTEKIRSIGFQFQIKY
jgi:hypothetical protein